MAVVVIVGVLVVIGGLAVYRRRCRSCGTWFSMRHTGDQLSGRSAVWVCKGCGHRQLTRNLPKLGD